MSKLKIIEGNVYKIDELDSQDIITLVSSNRHSDIIAMYKESIEVMSSELDEIKIMEKKIKKNKK